jgi:hypothetical protein
MRTSFSFWQTTAQFFVPAIHIWFNQLFSPQYSLPFEGQFSVAVFNTQKYHSPTLQASQENTFTAKCFVYFIFRQENWHDLGHGFPHCIAFPFTATSSAAKDKVMNNLFP